jgi:hypothetical protein
MKQKNIISALLASCVFLLLGGSCWANVPAPPVNQQIGIGDAIFNNLSDDDCRQCHDTGGTANSDRHHLLYGEPIPGGSVVPYPDSDNDGTPDSTYGCLNCHREEVVGGVITITVETNCVACHVQIPGEASIHHLTGTAQGTNSPLGDPAVGDCTPCHGTLVDDIGDSHVIPSYAPSLVTPSPSDGNGLPLNSRGNGAGACDYCHDSGTDAATGIQVSSNYDTHHNTGVFIDAETGNTVDSRCLWCHNFSQTNFRQCEGCHGYESLHNIQVDSPNSANPGVIVVGGETAGYGHIGRDAGADDSDCWGCHGFAQASAAVGSGPVTPFITGPASLTVTAGVNSQVSLSGSAFTNQIAGYEWTSDVRLTASNGSRITLTPENISQATLMVTIPGTTPPGTYKMQAVKASYTASNPVALIIKPAVVITDTRCTNGMLIVDGSGFGDEPPAGAGKFINCKLAGVPVEIISWSDTQIVAAAPVCSDAVTVNALYGSASFGVPACAGNFDADQDVDGSDVSSFNENFGRIGHINPCTSSHLCKGDFDCDGDVDGSDAAGFKKDFGKGDGNSPCAQVAHGMCGY